MKWNDQVVWVTGASSGIGLELACELNGAGATVVRTARDVTKLSQTEALMPDPSRDICIPGDVTNAEELSRIAQDIVAKAGYLTCVVANAGTYSPTDPFPFPLEASVKMMDVNYYGLLNTINAALPIMHEQQTGRIVGISSIVGLRAIPRAAAYGASKAAATYFLESLRFQVQDAGIRIQVVHPGFVRTPLTDQNDFHMPFLISAEKAAKMIKAGIEKDLDEIHFPWQLTLLAKFMSVLPGWLYRLLMSRSIKV